MYKFKIKDEPFAVGYLSADSNSKHIRTGCGYVEAVKNCNIAFDQETGFPILDFGNMACTSSWSGGQGVNVGLLWEKANKNPDLSEDYRYIEKQMKNLDPVAHWSEFSEGEWDITNSKSGWGGTWGGHAVPNLIDFACLGTCKIREKIHRYMSKNVESEDFYKGLLLTLDAIENLGERILKKALTERGNTPSAKLDRIINTFSHCPKAPAATFEEAVCVYVTVFSLDGVDSPGRFDQYMYDFWRCSDYSSSRQALEDIWVFFHQTRTWNLCISGSDENWNDQTNDLTYEILDVARKFKFQTPNITMRCHRNTPEKLYKEAAKTIATGIGMPTLYNDEAVCTALISLGILPSHAHEYAMNGCNQIDIQGKSHMGLEDGEVNLGLALRYALTEGYNSKHHKYIGKKTPPAEDLDTFEKFFSAVKEQMDFLCDNVCSMANKAQRIYAEYTSNPIRSMTIEGCIEKGLDYKNHGPLYGHGQVLAEGIPDIADSVANIKKFVFEEKKYTLSDVRSAIENDFEGYSQMYRDFKNSSFKFGNDVEYVDSIAADIVDHFNSYLRTKKTYRGGIYAGGCSPFNRAADNGWATGALPNGKKDGDAMFGDSIGATPGNDINGPTALLNSCLRFDHTLPASGFILNIKFEKGLFCSDVGMEGFIYLLKSYFSNGGQQLSVTVVSRKELLDAQRDPVSHRDLIVRVGGFSEYFVNLCPALQANVISRTYY